MTLNSSKTVIFAHRGASGIFYENSLSAFDKAIILGAEGLETDCWLLKDKKTIVLHHDMVISSPNKELNISRADKNEIKKVRLPNGEKILTLREFLERFSNSKAQNGNLLQFSIDLQDLKVGRYIIPVLKEFGVLNRVFLCADSLLKLRRVRKISKNAKLVASNVQDLIIPENFQPKSKICDMNLYAFNIRAQYFESKMLNVLNSAGLKCFIWDLHTEKSLRKYLQFKPDVIYSNYPDLAVKIRNELVN
ncbi:MAG: glycerophosphodiester phosphodiesterase [Promethearchaeota archaeon]